MLVEAHDVLVEMPPSAPRRPRDSAPTLRRARRPVRWVLRPARRRGPPPSSAARPAQVVEHANLFIQPQRMMQRQHSRPAGRSASRLVRAKADARNLVSDCRLGRAASNGARRGGSRKSLVLLDRSIRRSRCSELAERQAVAVEMIENAEFKHRARAFSGGSGTAGQRWRAFQHRLAYVRARMHHHSSRNDHAQAQSVWRRHCIDDRARRQPRRRAADTMQDRLDHGLLRPASPTPPRRWTTR